MVTKRCAIWQKAQQMMAKGRQSAANRCAIW